MSGEISTDVRHEPTSALVDLRQLAMSVDIATMQAGLAEYVDKRKTFREWLLKQMVEGVHYGVVPGCEPKLDAAGNLIISQKKSDKWVQITVNKNQWRHKRCLYKAGAEFIIDLMGVRQEYIADVDAAKMLTRGDAAVVAYKCRLLSRNTGELVGEGIGAGTLGSKGADHNKTVKDAQKRAMVAAVLNSYGLSDLFTQDMDDKPPKPEAEQPQPRDDAPIAQPRSERLKTEDVKKLGGLLRDYLGSRGADNSDAAVSEWLVRNGFFKTAEESTKLSNWKPDIYASLKEKLEQLTNGN